MLVLVALILLALSASRSTGLGAPLQPETYRSPSGEWSLEVDPSSRCGAGAGNYLMTRAGEPIWAKRLEFTLRAVRIDEHGYAAGYAYDRGWNGVAPNGNFVLAVLSPSGEVLGQHAWPTQVGWGIHSSPEPWVRESILDP